MNTKHISESNRLRLKLVMLPVSAKMAITIILISMAIVFIVTVQQAPIHKLIPSFLMDQIKDDPLRGLFFNENTGKNSNTEPELLLRDGAARIDIGVDQHPFFVNEYDFYFYGSP